MASHDHESAVGVTSRQSQSEGCKYGDLRDFNRFNLTVVRGGLRTVLMGVFSRLTVICIRSVPR
eukprot:SAG11_NODE_5972_length_1422_cov_1.489040_1_plen_63_part_10